MNYFLYKNIESGSGFSDKRLNAELIKYPFGHFDIYTGDAFKDAVTRQTRFLLAHLEPK
jgi:hypothetical protein